MNLKKYKLLFYILTFVIVWIVSVILKEITPGKHVPAVSDTFLIISVVLIFIILIFTIIKVVKGKFSHNNHNKPHEAVNKQETTLSENHHKKSNSNKFTVIIAILFVILAGSYLFDKYAEKVANVPLSASQEKVNTGISTT